MLDNRILTKEFFTRDVLYVAPNLLGKNIVRQYANGKTERFCITQVEAYRGEDDLACHARKGRTPRTDVMYWQGGYIYVYLIYGIYYMLNFVTAEIDNPQAILIRGVNNIIGPGRVGKILQIDNTFNKQSLFTSNSIWVEDTGLEVKYKTDIRIGIDYAGNYWKNKPWRFIKL